MKLPVGLDYKTRLFFEEFNEKCGTLADMKLAVYGIGECTRDLIDFFPEYSFIALLDREPENVGRFFYGLPVITLAEASDTADAVLIVSFTRLYWDIIYRRISSETAGKIPVFYMNGEKASDCQDAIAYKDSRYWVKNESYLKQEIQRHDIISFDVFDTLIMRRTFVPHDIFWLVEKKTEQEFLLPRRNAEALSAERNGQRSSLEFIYQILEEQREFTGNYTKEQMIHAELNTELESIVPRYAVRELFEYARSLGKTVYLLTDMYLPGAWIEKMLQHAGILGYEAIWVSCELGVCKSTGQMWDAFSRHTEGKSVLHIGDNEDSDVHLATKYHIDAFHIWSACHLLCHSSMADLPAHVLKQQDASILGCILQREFNSPFVLNNTKGLFQITSLEQLGYIAFGPMVFSYVTWLLQQTSHSEAGTMLFLARDSYVNYQIYQMFVKELKLKDYASPVYLKTSRAMSMAMAVFTKNDIRLLLELSYEGRFRDFIYTKFAGFRGADKDPNAEMQINTYSDKERITDWLRPYEDDILKHISGCRKQYIKYIQSQCRPDGKIAFSDIGYSGSNQHFLEKIIHNNGTGYYVNALLRDDNPFCVDGHIKAFFQDKSDPEGNNSNIKKMTLIVEAALTGPEGMYIGCDEEGNFINLKPGMNQIRFSEKAKIHSGIREFCMDMFHMLDGISIWQWEPSWVFPDYLLGVIFSEKCSISSEVKNSFYVDNEISGLKEKRLFD